METTASANERLIEPSSLESVEEQKYLLLDSLTLEFCEQLIGKITVVYKCIKIYSMHSFFALLG